MSSTRTFLPLVFAVASLFLFSRCDLLGSDDGSGSDPRDPQTTADAWDGSYEGSGSEFDYRSGFYNTTEIEPTLMVSFEDSTTLRVLQLEWLDGQATIPTSGEVKKLTADSLITAVDSATIQDSVDTWYQFRLARTSGDSSQVDEIDGALRQYYGDNYVLDSTIVRFEVTRDES